MAAGLLFFLIGFAVCAGVAIFLAVGLAIIFALGKTVGTPVNRRQLETIIEDWAERNHCELIDVADVTTRDHPFAERFGLGFGKGAGVVKRVEVRDPHGHTRHAWVYVKARFVGKGYSGFLPDSLEAVWEEGE